MQIRCLQSNKMDSCVTYVTEEECVVAGCEYRVLFGCYDTDDCMGENLIFSTPRDNVMRCRHVIMGPGGNNVINVNGRHNNLYFDLGDDMINGGTGEDEINGGEVNDIVLGGSFNDLIHGGAENDLINSGEGDNDQDD